MSKFKVGDKVKVLRDLGRSKYTGFTGTFHSNGVGRLSAFVQLDKVPGLTCFFEDELELITLNKPHKHAELIKAWADNPALVFQWKHRTGFWTDWVGNAPDWSYSEIRIKPTPTPDRVRYATFGEYVNGHWKTSREPHANVQATFDGETGKLKAVELLA